MSPNRPTSRPVAIVTAGSGPVVPALCERLARLGYDVTPLEGTLSDPAVVAAAFARFAHPPSLLINVGIDLRSAALLSKALLQHRKASALIVNIFDQERDGDSLSTHRAWRGFTLTMAESAAPGCRVCAIVPGPNPADSADALEFLICNPALTGQILRIEGAPRNGPPHDFAFL